MALLDDLTLTFIKTVYREWPRVMQAVTQILGSEASRSTVSGGNRITINPRHGAQIVAVRNDSGADVPQFGVLGIDSPLVMPTVADRDRFTAIVSVVGKTPVVATHTGNFVVTCGPIKKGESGPAWMSGVFPCTVNITSAGDTHADVQASTLELKTGTSGAAQIIWKAAGTGTGKLAYVRIGGGGSSGGGGQWFKLKTDASSGIATCNTWNGSTIGSTDITVRVVTKKLAGELVFAHQYTGYTAAQWREAAPDFSMFPVLLTQTGGSAGNKTTKCDFLYTVKDVTNTHVYGTSIAPEDAANYSNGKRKAALKGMAYFDLTSNVKLFCFEDRTDGSC